MAARKKVAKKKTARRKPAKRELIDTVRPQQARDILQRNRGPGRSLAQDRRRKAKKVAKRGQGDRGDRRRKT
jgi:hypothetical protein